MRGRALLALALAALLAPLAAAPAGSAVLCFGQAPTMFAQPGVTTLGTPGPDVILGTAGNDTIRGRGGNDRICGLGGNDDLAGNAGRDRLDGGDGRDTLRGGADPGNLLVGGPGDDTIIATSGQDTARGRGGDDYIDARSTAFSIQRGGPGNDTIYSGYRSDLDAGTGTDHCALGMDVTGTNCETVELLCGSGGDSPPFLAVNLTTAHGDFDGNGTDDTLFVSGSGASWSALIYTDGGFGSRIVLPTGLGEAAKAIGGHDVNGDGVEEAFVKVGSGASTDIVGLYTLYEPVGSPATGFSCGTKAITFYGVPAEAEFAIGASVMNASGLACRADHTLREFHQTTVDGTHYTQDRYDYPYLPGFGVAAPALGTSSAWTSALIWPADQAAIQQAGRLTCGSLSL